jgi:hypothetical protein
MDRQAVLVTTAYRGVFFGYLVAEDGDTCTLADARMCVYWPSENHGVLGLASDGPREGARVSPRVQELRLRAITAIAPCTAEAADRWESEPWN